jgi:hypothetical protein
MSCVRAQDRRETSRFTEGTRVAAGHAAPRRGVAAGAREVCLMASLRTCVFGGAVMGVLSLLACFGAIEPSAAEGACAEGERYFNGACRASCARTAECGREVCAQVEGATQLCYPAKACVYLGDDTECLGVGEYETTVCSGSGPRGGGRTCTQRTTPYMSTPGADPSRATGYEDATFEQDPRLRPYEGSGCRGNAVWIKRPMSGDPVCTTTHRVRRCRRVVTQYNGFQAVQCLPIEGTTRERPE